MPCFKMTSLTKSRAAFAAVAAGTALTMTFSKSTNFKSNILIAPCGCWKWPGINPRERGEKVPLPATAEVAPVFFLGFEVFLLTTFA